MQIETHESFERSRPWIWYGLLGFLFLAGFALASAGGALHQIALAAGKLSANLMSAKALSLAAVGAAAAALLVRHAEVALGLFFLVGLVKGDPRLASTPVDLTVLTAGIITVAVAWRVMASKAVLRLPSEHLLYLPLVGLMVVSLTYTPDFSAGADKILRFVCLTGIGIVAPFVILDSTAKIRRCLYTLAIGGIALAINSLTMLGGEERLVSPSGLNTELGAASAVALIVIWGLVFPRLSLLQRVLLYPVLGVLAVALLGSGGRFANVSTVICIVVGTFLCRSLVKDVVVICGLGVLALPLIWIPSASYEYLASLSNPSGAMGTRDDLMAFGIKVISEHPLLGVGVNGFRFVSPNPITYNYPHNLILELGAELGFLAALLFLVIAFCSFRESLRQLFAPLSMDDPTVHTVFLLLIYVFLDAMVSGDINDLRFMWFMFALPFVMRELQARYVRGALPSMQEFLPMAPPLPANWS